VISYKWKYVETTINKNKENIKTYIERTLLIYYGKKEDLKGNIQFLTTIKIK
jgi:hypothetical protein